MSTLWLRVGLVAVVFSCITGCGTTVGPPRIDKTDARVFEVVSIEAGEGAADFGDGVAVTLDGHPVDIQGRDQRTVQFFVPMVEAGPHVFAVKLGATASETTRFNVEVLPIDEAAVLTAVPRAIEQRKRELAELEAELFTGVPGWVDQEALRADLQRLHELLSMDSPLGQLPEEGRRQVSLILWGNERQGQANLLTGPVATTSQPLVVARSCANVRQEEGVRCLEINLRAHFAQIGKFAIMGALMGGALGTFAIPGVGTVAGEYIGALSGLAIGIISLNMWLIEEAEASIQAVKDSLGISTLRDANALRLSNNNRKTWAVKLGFSLLQTADLDTAFVIPRRLGRLMASFTDKWNEALRWNPFRSKPFSFDRPVRAPVMASIKKYLTVEPAEQTHDGWTVKASLTNGELTVSATGSSSQDTTFDVNLVFDNPGVAKETTKLTFTAGPFRCSFPKEDPCQADYVIPSLPPRIFVRDGTTSDNDLAHQACVGTSLHQPLAPGVYAGQQVTDSVSPQFVPTVGFVIEFCDEGYYAYKYSSEGITRRGGGQLVLNGARGANSSDPSKPDYYMVNSWKSSCTVPFIRDAPLPFKLDVGTDGAWLWDVSVPIEDMGTYVQSTSLAACLVPLSP